LCLNEKDALLNINFQEVNNQTARAFNFSFNKLLRFLKVRFHIFIKISIDKFNYPIDYE